MTAHDGFTLRDCVCFTNKHNEANGEENRDGTSNNYSDNHGKEGLGGTLDLIEPATRQHACPVDDVAAFSGYTDVAGGR